MRILKGFEQRMVDRIVRSARPRWLRNRMDRAFSRYERFGPVARIELPPGRTLAVIAPHPDDESIGCGGLIALWTAAGRRVEVVFLTGGEMGSAQVRVPGLSDADRQIVVDALRLVRRKEAEVALGLLGATGIWFDGTDGALHRDEDRLTARLCEVWSLGPPDLIAAPFPTDRHADHAVAARIVAHAAKRVLTPDAPVLGYEVWSPAAANAVLNITQVAKIKWQAIAAHQSQIATTDYVAAARALNCYRAISNGQPSGFAEAYHATTCGTYAEMIDALKV